jgi:hypothetical protein
MLHDTSSFLCDVCVMFDIFIMLFNFVRANSHSWEVLQDVEYYENVLQRGYENRRNRVAFRRRKESG